MVGFEMHLVYFAPFMTKPKILDPRFCRCQVSMLIAKKLHSEGLAREDGTLRGPWKDYRLLSLQKQACMGLCGGGLGYC